MAVNPNRPALPIGWPLLPVPDADGALNWPDLGLSIRQTIRALLVTEPGERMLHRKLGGGLQQFIHAPNTLLERRRIHDRVAEMLLRHEPRIQLNSITVEPAGEFGELVEISISYSIRMTGQADQVTMALGLGG